MASFRYPVPLPSELTPKEAFIGRRQAILAAGGASFAGAFGVSVPARSAVLSPRKTDYLVNEATTPKKDVTSYNNFYEFGLDKSDPSTLSGHFKARPWTVTVGGLVSKPTVFDIDKLISSMSIEERIYRMRCVEAWSMVIPWDGFPLSALLSQVEPLGSAKYVAFETVVRPSEMPGQRSGFDSLQWPYVEGLRLDEAMNPLTFMAVGLYGETLENQNGAPFRLVVPWKYGFKGIKSITRISLVEHVPPTSWNRMQPDEYGFYANVNPEVDHPRWSQASERVIGGSGFFGGSRKKTLMFNGYAEQVAGLYSGMNLRENF